jgi:hypothetical protein
MTRITALYLKTYVPNISNVSRWILLRMRNVLEKILRDSKNTSFIFTNFFKK